MIKAITEELRGGVGGVSVESAGECRQGEAQETSCELEEGRVVGGEQGPRLGKAHLSLGMRRAVLLISTQWPATFFEM